MSVAWLSSTARSSDPRPSVNNERRNSGYRQIVSGYRWHRRSIDFQQVHACHAGFHPDDRPTADWRHFADFRLRREKPATGHLR